MTARIRRSTALLGSKPKQKIDFFKIKEIKLISLNFTTTYPNQKLLLFIISNFQSNNQDFFLHSCNNSIHILCMANGLSTRKIKQKAQISKPARIGLYGFFI